MVSRRSVIAATAPLAIGAALPRATLKSQTPVGSPEATPASNDFLDVISLSSDGGTVAVQTPEDEIAFVNVRTRHELQKTEPYVDMSAIEFRAMPWNPSGTHMAFGLDAWKFGRDSNILVCNVSDGSLTDITVEEQPVGDGPYFSNPDALVDIFPIWLDDDTILFARHQFLDAGATCTLMTISAAGGTPEPWLDVTAAGYRWVNGPMTRTKSGRIIMPSTNSESNDDVLLGIDPDGTVEELDTAGLDTFQLLGANDTHYLLYDPRVQVDSVVMVPFDDLASATSPQAYMGIEENSYFSGMPLLGTEPDTLLLTSLGDNSVYLKDDQGVRSIGEIPQNETVVRSYWQKNTIVLVGANQTWTLEI